MYTAEGGGTFLDNLILFRAAVAHLESTQPEGAATHQQSGK